MSTSSFAFTLKRKLFFDGQQRRTNTAAGPLAAAGRLSSTLSQSLVGLHPAAR